MKFSPRSQYAIRLMVALARHYDGGPIPLSELDRDEGLPLPYLEQMAAQLRRTALLRSRSGVRGGYTLARSPDSITIADIVRCLEGSLAPVSCLAAGGAGRCGHAATPCAAHAFWERLQESIVATLEGTSVADLVGEASAERSTASGIACSYIIRKANEQEVTTGQRRQAFSG